MREKLILGYLITGFDCTIQPLHPPPNITQQNSLPGLYKRWPEIIITGMQKCGTGALKDYLLNNPFLEWSSVGESHFFDRKYGQGLNTYLAMQPPVGYTVKIFDKTPR